MSTEIVSRKRGRPKKSTLSGSAVEVDATPSDSGLRKKNGSTNKLELPTSKDSRTSLEKKSARKKQSASGLSTTPSTEIEKSSTVGILGQANAFANIKQSVEAFSNGNGLTKEQLLQTDETLYTIREKMVETTEDDSSQHISSQTIKVVENGSTDTFKHLLHDRPQKAKMQIEQSIEPRQRRSQFLSVFLDDTKHENPPIAPDNAKFSDKSALKAETPSIEDIIRGPGVTTFIDRTKSAEPGPSNIGLEGDAIRSFEPLTISKFPVVSQAGYKNSVSPATYPYASFTAFKQSAPLRSQASNAVPTKARIPSEKSQSLPTQPSSASKATTTSVSRPVRPTEMSYEELSKQPKYQQLKWKYTVLMVGVPVILVTSWVLWKRLVEEQVDRRHQRSIAPSTLGIDRANSNVTSNGGV